MRRTISLLAGITLAAGPAFAADELKFGKPPTWVIAQTVPAPTASAEAPIALLLTDHQIRMEPGKLVTFSELAMKIQKPEGLSAGNISIPWNPATDTVTVNKLEIHRGNQVIDVLAGGQRFTTLRREQGLEEATLDGFLTANIQPEGLQEGDIVDLATTIEHADPVLGNHVETNFAEWPALPIRRAHVRLEWPASLKVNLRAKGVTAKPVMRAGMTMVEIAGDDVQPIIPPQGAPRRFNITRLGEATDFNSWADVARLVLPLYRKGSVIPASGPLHDEVEKIRAFTKNPKLRAEKALQMVQDRVRYVALLMGQGGYVPAQAETTWSRRFGDCKAKTALLLGVLHELGIDAEPLLVQSSMGDAIAERLPMLSYFDHVLVRAHVAGKSYYLDGTRTGDTELENIHMPGFGWALPVEDNAELIALVAPSLDRPQSNTTVVIDASGGIYTPADINIVQVMSGDLALAFNSGLVSLTDSQRKEFFDKYWKNMVDDISPGDSSFGFEKTTRELHMSVRGKLTLDWSGGFFHLPLSSIGYTPDLDRPEGPSHNAPFAVAHPVFTRAETKLRMPARYFPADVARLVPAAVHQTLIGVEYSRIQTATPDDMTVQTSTRSLVPEVSYKDAVAARSTLKALAYGDVSVRLPVGYHATAADLAALKADPGGSAADLVNRGNTLNDNGQFQDAVAMFDRALELDPRNAAALADRAVAHTWLRKFDLAKRDVDAALVIDPTNAVAFRARGLSAELMEKWAQAIDAYTTSLQAESQNGFALGHRAICEAALSRHDEALADSTVALKSDHTWIDLRVLRANILITLRRNDDAASEAKLAAVENPQSTYALVAAGRIYARIKRNTEAMKAFDAALAIKPEAFIYLNRAQSRPFADKSGRLADLDAAFKLEPNNPDTVAEKAEQLAADGDLKGARQLYDGLIKSVPNEDYFGKRRAVLLFKTGDAAEARRLFAGFRMKAKSANEFNSLCGAKGTAGILLEEALDECHEALKREPNAGAYLDSLALVELRLGQIDQAIADYTLALTKNGGAASYMGRALAYARKGDGARSAADLAQALALDPDEQMRFAEFGLKLDDARRTGSKAAPAH